MIQKSEFQSLVTALPLIKLYQHVKFHKSSLNAYKDMLRTNSVEVQETKGNNSQNIKVRVTKLVHCTSSHYVLSAYQVS